MGTQAAFHGGSCGTADNTDGHTAAVSATVGARRTGRADSMLKDSKQSVKQYVRLFVLENKYNRQINLAGGSQKHSNCSQATVFIRF